MLSLTPELTRLEVKPRKMVQPEGGRGPAMAARSRCSALSGSSLAAICGSGGTPGGVTPSRDPPPGVTPPSLPGPHHPLDLRHRLREARGLEAGGAEGAEQRRVVRAPREVVAAHRERLGREGPAGPQHGPERFSRRLSRRRHGSARPLRAPPYWATPPRAQCACAPPAPQDGGREGTRTAQTRKRSPNPPEFTPKARGDTSSVPVKSFNVREQAAPSSPTHVPHAGPIPPELGSVRSGASTPRPRVPPRPRPPRPHPR